MANKQSIMPPVSESELKNMIVVAVYAAFKTYLPLYLDRNNPTEVFLSIQEAATYLNLSKATLYSKVSKKELPVMKRGKRLYFSNVELMEYLKEGRRKTITETNKEADNYLLQKKSGKSIRIEKKAPYKLSDNTKALNGREGSDEK